MLEVVTCTQSSAHFGEFLMFAFILGFSVYHLGLGLFFSGLGFLIYVYCAYPAVITLFAATRRVKASLPSTDLGISLIIAAHNEKAVIRKKIEETLALDYPPERLQIIVASDGSSDGTDEAVMEFSNRGVLLVPIPCRAGKTNAQNEAVKFATHEILVFSDATTHYQSDALQFIAGRYRDLRIGAVSGCYRYYDPTLSSPTASGTSGFWNFENHLKTMQSRIRTISGCCGCIYSVRRNLYTSLPARIISDLVQPLHILLQGYTVAFEPRARAWEETTATTVEEFRMRVRVITRGMHGLMSVSALLAPWLYPWIALQLWSHKVLRWFTPFFCIAMFLGNLLLLDSSYFQVLIVLQVAFYLIAAMGALLPSKRWPRLLTLPLYICTICAASLVSLFQLLQGHSFSVWQPVRR